MVHADGFEEMYTSNLQNHESHFELKSCGNGIDGR